LGVKVFVEGLTPALRFSCLSLYQAFPAAEARRLLNRLEFHYVPKHASWLNTVEIELVCRAANAWIAHRQQGTPQIRNRCLGAAAQYVTCPHKMDVHH
jgi:hypothetical protein